MHSRADTPRPIALRKPEPEWNVPTAVGIAALFVGAVVITAMDIHLPRRIGEALKRAFHGHLELHY
jgi:hypothetical protein